MDPDHDRIDMEITIDVDVNTAWNFISQPGWFINEGQLSEHEITWDENTATVIDANHGTIQFQREASDPPRYMADRGTQADRSASTRLVEFWLRPLASGVVVRIAETGFSSMPVPRQDQIAQHEQNTITWRQQLKLAKQCLES